MSEPIVVELTPEETHPLRLGVLRFDTPTKEVVFKEDTWPGAVHLGLRVDGELVATSSWVPREHDGRPGVQLRRHGHRSSLAGLRAGWRAAGGGMPRAMPPPGSRWCGLARDAALAFYLRHGFEVEGDGFIDENTQLPHHLVVRHLVVRHLVVRRLD